MVLGDTVDSRKPSIQAAVSSPTALSNLVASFLLLVCVFFPHSVGEDTPNRPLSLFGEENAILALMVSWPYWFGFATFVVMMSLAVFRPARIDKALLGLPTVCGVGLTVLWTMLLFSRAEESRSAMVMAAIVAPIGACVVARMVWLYRAGQMIAAATWGQSLLCVLAVFSLRWLWHPPVTRLFWGGMLSITAAILMMLASWTWVTRARHDLSDLSDVPVPFQVSLREIILGITLIAIALTYWRVVAAWA